MHRRFDDGADILEDVTLGEDVAALANLKGVAVDVVEEVIDLMFFLLAGLNLCGWSRLIRDGAIRTAWRRVLPWTFGIRPLRL